jgi:hypothetical protein
MTGFTGDDTTEEFFNSSESSESFGLIVKMGLASVGLYPSLMAIFPFTARLRCLRRYRIANTFEEPIRECQKGPLMTTTPPRFGWPRSLA